MWKVIMLLWSVPILLGLGMLIRIARGSPALTEQEQGFLFGDGAEPSLSLWLGIKLAVLSVVLFFVGLAYGLVIINTNSLWMMLVPPITTFSVMSLLAWWLRSASVDNPISQPDLPGPHPSESRTPGMLSR